MRYVLTAAAACLAVSMTAPSPSLAQSTPSMQDSFNACLELAKQRGWSQQDITNNRPAARAFVVRCMQGGEAKAKAKTKKRKS
jgi:hypothetical protein